MGKRWDDAKFNRSLEASMFENLHQKEGEGKFMDRREEPRIKMRVPAAFTLLRHETGPAALDPGLQFLSNESETMDLSHQGLCLLTPMKLSKGDVVALELRFPYGKPVQVEAEVRWCQESEDVEEAGMYHVGMKFSDAGQDKNDELGRMLLKAFMN